MPVLDSCHEFDAFNLDSTTTNTTEYTESVHESQVVRAVEDEILIQPIAERVHVDTTFPYSKQPQRLDNGGDAEIARRVVAYIENIKGKLVFAEGAFYIFNATEWQAISDDDIRRIILRWDGATFLKEGRKTETKVTLSQQRLKSIYAIMATYAGNPDFFSFKQPGINCKNGFLYISNAGNVKLIPHSPEHRCRHTLNAVWRGEAIDTIPEGTMLHRLMEGCFKDADDKEGIVRLIGEIMGVAAGGMAQACPEPKAAVFIGATAGNGKGQVIRVIEGLLPPHSISHVTPDNMGDDNKASALIGKLLNTSNELTSAAIASDKFKQVITGEAIQVRRLYRDAIVCECKAMHVFATNVLPTFSGGFDAGVRRRLMVVPFTRTIPLSEREVDIGNKICEHEADIVLAYAVAGLQRFIQNNGFSQPDECVNKLSDWVVGADQVAGWLDECVVKTDDVCDVVLTKEAWMHFNDWCRGMGLSRTIPSAKSLTERLLGRGFKTRRRAQGYAFVGMQVSGLEAVLRKHKRIENVRQGLDPDTP